MRDLGPNDPTTIGPYRLVAELGRGGMGRVLLAVEPPDRLVAVKLVLDEFLGDADFRARFEREVVASGRVVGPYTARLIAADSAATPPWLATDFVDGPTLAAVLSRHGTLDADLTRRLGAFLVAALGDVHGADLVHRDLTPTNVMFTDGDVTVIDFGIARALTGDDGALTRTKYVIGKMGYHSPEQLDKRRITGASDVFTLGTVLAEASSGANPFAYGPDYELMSNIARNPPRLDGVPGDLRPIVERCLAKDPAARPGLVELRRELGAPPTDGRPWPDAVRDLVYSGRMEIAAALGGKGFARAASAEARRADQMRGTRVWPAGGTSRAGGPPPSAPPGPSREHGSPFAPPPPSGGVPPPPPRPAAPPPRPSTTGPAPAWVAVAAVLTVIALILWTAQRRDAEGDDVADDPTTSTSTASPVDEDTWSPSPDPEVFPDAVVGDCVVNGGDEDDIDLQFTTCSDWTFEVVGVESWSDAEECWDSSDTDWAVKQESDDMTLCLMYRHGSTAYRAEEGDCVFRWEDDGPWSKETCDTGVFTVIERRDGEDDLDSCADSYLLDWSVSLGSDEMDSLDRVLCLSIVYPDDIGHAPVDTCMWMTEDGDDRTFEFTDCDSANVIVTGRTGDADDSDFCRDHGWAAWESNYYPELSYRVCWNWY